MADDLIKSKDELEGRQRGGIVIPALLWWAGVPLLAVVLLWLLFFR